MPKKRRKPRTTFSLQIKKGKRFKKMPSYTKKQKKDILLGRKKIPALYAVERKGKKVVKARKMS